MTSPAKSHLTFGGSSAYRWLRCAGSARLIATLPPQIENEYMKEGTRAHALLELAVAGRRDSVLDFVDQRLNTVDPVFTRDDVEAVQVALDYVNEIMKKYPAHELYVERHVTLGNDVGGTADVVIYIPETRTLHVIDYKHGRGKYVEVEGNPQLKLYAAATLLSFSDLDVGRIDATIAQPRCQVGEPIRTAIYSPADLIMFSDDVEEAVALATKPDAPFTPGDEQCHWCPAAKFCPALQGGVAVALNAAPRAADMIVLSMPSAEVMRNDPAALADVLRAAGVIEDWLDAVKSHAEAYANGGGKLPGFKVVEKRASRKWADEDLAKAWFTNETLLGQDDFAPRKMLSVAQAEALVKKLIGKDGVKALAGHVIKESSGTKLVPETAPGEAVNPHRLIAGEGGDAGDILTS